MSSETRIHRLAFEGKDAEDALVNSPEWLFAYETLEGLDAERELAERQGTLHRQPTRAEALQVLGKRVLGAVDDPQILGATALYRRLNDATPTTGNKIERFDNHPFATAASELFPPTNSLSLRNRVRHLDNPTRCGGEHRRGSGAKLLEHRHVPAMVLPGVHLALGGEQVERRHPQIVDGADLPAIPSILIDVLFRQNQSLTRLHQKRPRIDAVCGRTLQSVDDLRERGTRCRADGSVLRAQQLLRLGRPGHQLAIEAHPVRCQLVPEPGLVGGGPDAREQPRFKGLVVKEASTGSRVTNAALSLEHTEALSRDR